MNTPKPAAEPWFPISCSVVARNASDLGILQCQKLAWIRRNRATKKNSQLWWDLRVSACTRACTPPSPPSCGDHVTDIA